MNVNYSFPDLWKQNEFLIEGVYECVSLFEDLFSLNKDVSIKAAEALLVRWTALNSKMKLYTDDSVKVVLAFANASPRRTSFIVLAMNLWHLLTNPGEKAKPFVAFMNHITQEVRFPNVDMSGEAQKICRLLTPIPVVVPERSVDLEEEMLPRVTPVTKVTLSLGAEKDLEELREKYGEKVADLARAAKVEQQSKQWKMAQSAAEPAVHRVTCKIPSRLKEAPFFILQLFYLFAAMFVPTEDARTFSFEEESLPMRMLGVLGKNAYEAIIEEIARLRKELAEAQKLTVRNQVLESRLTEKIRVNNEALNNLNSGKSQELGTLNYVLPAKKYTFRCKETDVEQIRSLIRRWRIHSSEVLPEESDYEPSEDFSFDSALPESAFAKMRVVTKSLKEDLITSILNLRTIPSETLMRLANLLNSLQATKEKVVEIYDMASYPDWAQKIFNSGVKLTKAVKKIAARAEEIAKAQKLSAEDKAFIAACAQVEDAQMKKILQRAVAASTAELPAIWRIAVIDSLSKANKDEFLRMIADGEIDPNDRYVVPKVETPKESYADVIKKVNPKLKAKGDEKAALTTDWLLREFKDAYPDESTMPSFLSECLAINPLYTSLIVRKKLVYGQQGLQNSPAFRELPRVKSSDDAMLEEFLKAVFRVDFTPTAIELERIRQLIKDRRLLQYMQKSKKEQTEPVHNLADLEKQVSSFPVREVKSSDGKPAKSGKSSKKTSGNEDNGAKPKSSGRGNKSGGKPTADGKTKKQSKSAGGRKSSTKSADGAGAKSGANNATRSITIDGVAYTVNDLKKRAEGTRKSGKDTLVVGNNSFKVAFFNKKVDDKSVVKLESMFGSNGKRKGKSPGGPKKGSEGRKQAAK